MHWESQNLKQLCTHDYTHWPEEPQQTDWRDEDHMWQAGLRSNTFHRWWWHFVLISTSFTSSNLIFVSPSPPTSISWTDGDDDGGARDPVAVVHDDDDDLGSLDCHGDDQWSHRNKLGVSGFMPQPRTQSIIFTTGSTTAQLRITISFNWQRRQNILMTALWV